MNTYKNIFRACNGTRIAQCSLLIALAFLCLAIVFMCVFYNLNALATNNIAYAEEDEEITRNAVGSYAYVPNNLIPNNYCLNWTYSISNSASGVSDAEEIASNSCFSVRVRGTLTNNILSPNSYIYFYVKSNTYFSYSYLGFYIASDGYTSGYQLQYYKSSSNSLSNFMYEGGSFNTYKFYCVSGYSSSNVSVGDYFILSNPNNSSLNLRALGFYSQSNSTFSGYVSPSYSEGGYNQGYNNGYSDGSGSVNYGDISSTGIVRENLLDNNDWINASYNISVTDSTNIFFDGVNFDNELVCDGTASIIGNTYSNDRLSCIRFNVKSFDTPIITASKYTFTICVANVNSRSSTYVGAFVGNWGDQDQILVGSDADGFYSYTFDFTSLSSYDFNDFYLELETRAGASFDILWFKFEEGESFSGYVPKSYKMYGYNDGVSAGRDIGYQEGYQDGYDSASLESFNRIGDLENMSFTQNYVVGDKTLMCHAVEEDSFTYDGTRYEYQYFETEGEEEVYNGLVIDYNFSYKVRIITQFFGSDARWNEVGFKILIIDSSNHNSYFFVTRDDTQYITFLSTWTNVGNAFGDIYNVQIDIPLPDNTKYYNIAFVPINWNYHDINADSRSLRASSYQDTSSMLIWDNTQLYGLTTQSNYANIVEDRVHEAWSDGHYQGIQEGRSQGESTGYTIGYNAGVNAAGDYTFYSLLGAVFDTPISTLRGLLNFNILGVNLYDFVIALLSLAIVLFVFRIFVRGL